MPTYDYRCPKCGYEFEHFQQMSEKPLKKCPKCGKTGVKRLIGGGAGLIFKGTGFYITDYKKSGSKGGEEPKAAASESKPASDSKGSAEPKPAQEKKPSGEKPASGGSKPAA